MQHHSPSPDTSYGRRDFLRRGGGLLIAFSLLGTAGCAEEEDGPEDGPVDSDRVNAWLRVAPDGTVTVLTGKIAIGQGILIALRQIAAEELDLPLDRVTIRMADTGLTPNESYTAGSASIEGSGRAIRRAAATARRLLLERAAKQLDTSAGALTVRDGTVSGAAGSVTFRELIGDEQLTAKVAEDAPRKSPADYRLVGTPVPRPEIADMVSGGAVYVQDMRPPGMVHARVVRPPVYGAVLRDVPEDPAGVLRVVRDGNFLAVIADDEYRAIQAWQSLTLDAAWERPAELPPMDELFTGMPDRATGSEVVEKSDDGRLEAEEGIEAVYTRPYQMHGSIGPSCALAEWKDDRLTVWTHSQGVFPLRGAVAGMLGLGEDAVRVIGVRGSGCYGHNGADDVAADAARLAMAVPGRPVRVQWMRQDEHAWEPYGSAMRLRLRARLDDDGRIAAWRTDVWTDVHSHRPGGNPEELITAQSLEGGPAAPTDGYLGGGYRNSRPLYAIPALHVEAHRVEGPLRVSALRSLGAYGNVFAIESFMDELAERAGEDPVDFRLRHLEDGRARAVLESVRQSGATGEEWGYGFTRYKNEAAYCAVAARVSYDAAAGTLRVDRLIGAIDAGQVINPDGLRNQTEGGMIQSASWTLREQVRWDAEGITSLDWETYPILRFTEVPEVEVTVLDHPDAEPLGAGEAAQGPTAAAIANAVYRVAGRRVRDLPITSDKLRG